MNREKVRSIGKERLDKWLDHLVNDHATPVLLMGLGHDHNLGNVSLCITENITNEQIELFLMGVLQKIREGDVKIDQERNK